MKPDPFSPERFERFFEKIEILPAPFELRALGACWLWTGALDSGGYGSFHCPGFPSIKGPSVAKTVRAHRWVTVFWYGPQTLHHLTYDHLCLRPACVNPRHGSAVTHAKNVARSNVTRWEYRPEDPFEALGI